MRLSPPVKYFYHPIQGGASLVVHLCFSVLFLLFFHARLFNDDLWPSAGKGLTSWLSFVMSNSRLGTSVTTQGGSGRQFVTGP